MTDLPPSAPTNLTSQTAVALQGGQQAVRFFSTGNGMLLAFVVIAWIALAFLGKGKSGKLARGYFAGAAEKRAARNLAMKQLKERKHNAVTLYVGTPKHNQKGEIKPSMNTLWLPDAQRGVAVVGAPGSGKTFSILNPAVRSAIDLGHSVIVYDFKYPDQTELFSAYAAKRGYEVKIFAPGYPESEVCNLLDFLRNPDDALMARQIASVMNRNFAMNANASEDKFFSDAGDQLTQAIFMIAKSMPQPDLMMASSILNLPDLPQRLQAAYERKQPIDGWKMSIWIHMAFAQLLQLSGSEKTVAGVIGTASKVFSRFLAPELVGAFCGETTLPLDLHGKQLLILGLDRQRREAITPLVATVLHMIVTRNVTVRRKGPLVLAIDELPTLYLPYLTQWLNENRSDGLVTMVGFQNLNQLEKSYSKEISRAILGGCATKAIFNPQEQESARMFSEYVGEEEIGMQQKSRSSGKGGGSTSTSDQVHKRSIVEAAQFNKFPTGRCLLISPAYARKEEASIPFMVSVNVPAADRQAESWSKSKWAKVRERLIQNSHQINRSDEQNRAELDGRMAIAERLFPDPKKAQGPGQKPKDLPADVISKLKDIF